MSTHDAPDPAPLAYGSADNGSTFPLSDEALDGLFSPGFAGRLRDVVTALGGMPPRAAVVASKLPEPGPVE